MPTIDLGEDITPYYNDPMEDHLTIMHTKSDTYANSTACGDKLIHLHKELARLNFPYFFVDIVTTNTDIARELELLRSIYSNEEHALNFQIVDGEFNKQVYKGDTYCVLPWIHKYVTPSGLVMPCCVADPKYPIGNINNTPLENISTSNIRSQMLAGERPSACNECWFKEDLGITSQREKANREYAHCTNTKSFTLKFLDIRLSNKCNLMCRMCSGEFSNRIAQEEERLYGFTKYKDEVLDSKLVDDHIDYIEKNIHTLEHAYFAGGEPLINEEHYRILQLLIDYNKTDIKLSYNTNFSMLKFKKYDLLNLWSKFDNVIIGASIDLYGDQSNYVRHGVDYKKLEENYNKIQNQKNITFCISSTLHLMNVYNLPLLQKQWIEKGVDCSNISFRILLNPAEQSLTVLPEHYKNLALVEIHSHIEYLKTIPNSSDLIKKWEEARLYMTSRSDTHLLKEFFRLNDDKDLSRNQLFENYFPEFKHLRKYAA